MTKEERGDIYHQAMVLWRSGVNNSKNGYLQMGKAINLVKTKELWKDIGVKSFRQFCSKELHISEAQAHRLDQVYRELGRLLENIPIDIAKVTLLLPYLKDKDTEQRIEMLEMAAECSVEAIKNNILEMNGEHSKATDVCTHEKTETWERCLNCKKFFKP